MSEDSEQSASTRGRNWLAWSSQATWEPDVTKTNQTLMEQDSVQESRTQTQPPKAAVTRVGLGRAWQRNPQEDPRTTRL